MLRVRGAIGGNFGIDLVANRQLNDKFRSHSEAAAARADYAAMQFAQMARDREAEPETAIFAAAAGVALPEAFEDERHDLRVDADTVVAYGHLGVRIVPPQRDLNAASVGRELHRIRKHISNHLLQSIGIAGDCGVRPIERWLETDPFGHGSGPDYFDRAFYYRSQLDRSDVESHAAGHDARYVEQVGNHLIE